MLHKTKWPEESLPAESKSFVASPKLETDLRDIAQRLEAQYKDRTIVKINLFSGINGQRSMKFSPLELLLVISIAVIVGIVLAVLVKYLIRYAIKFLRKN